MKTKLLKKIRKEWVIYRVDSPGNNDYYNQMTDIFPIPFYISSKVGYYIQSSQNRGHVSLREAKDRVLEEVKSKYEPIFRKDKCTPKITKVWYV